MSLKDKINRNNLCKALDVASEFGKAGAIIFALYDATLEYHSLNNLWYALGAYFGFHAFGNISNGIKHCLKDYSNQEEHLELSDKLK